MTKQFSWLLYPQHHSGLKHTPDSETETPTATSATTQDPALRQVMNDLIAAREELARVKGESKKGKGDAEEALKKAEAALKKYQARDEQVVTDLWSKIPEARQKVLSSVKALLSADDLIPLLQSEVSMIKETSDGDDGNEGDDDEDRTKGRLRHGGDRVRERSLYKPKYTEEIEIATGMPVEFLPQLEQEKSLGGTIYRMPQNHYIAELKRRTDEAGLGGARLTSEAANNRAIAREPKEPALSKKKK